MARPPGMAKTGGRQRGSVNRATAAKVAEIAATGETPLDYMLRIMRDPQVEHERRDRAAVAAAAYVHPKLAPLDHHGQSGIVVVALDETDMKA